jgi:hypothetical protein
MRARFAVLGVLGAFGVALACGEVPTLPEGIAYVSPVLLPSPAVAAGDTLRDSTGKVAPLRLVAYDRNDQPVSGTTANFLPTRVPSPLTIKTSGIVVAQDTVTSSVTVVGQIGDRLQTAPMALLIVPQPDSLQRVASTDTLSVTGTSNALAVTVSGLRGGARVPVQGIIVRFQITRLLPAGAVDSTLYRLQDDARNFLRSDPRFAVDTTDALGGASRTVFAAPAPSVTAIEVCARATNLRGVPLTPTCFSVAIKR